MTRLRILLSVFLCLFLLAACGSASPAPTATPTVPPTAAPTAEPTLTPTPDTPAARLDAALLAQSPEFSGAVLVAQHGEVIFSQGYGLADIEQNISITDQTQFEIGSLTKSFTAAAVMMLQERGQLSVQDSICEYLDDCPAAWQAVTLHQLLTHSSGIPDYVYVFGPRSGSADFCRAYTADEVLAAIRDEPLEFEPGTSYAYSNSGYYLLGMVIERVTGLSYDEFIHQNILDPLGMTSTGYASADQTGDDFTPGYTRASSFSSPQVASCWDVSLKFAAGGLYSTVWDLYQWDQALNSDRLISQESLDAIFAPQVEMTGEEGSYGYGWMIYDRDGRHSIEHGGKVFGYVAYIARYPDEDVTIILLSNRDWLQLGDVAQDLAAVLFGE